MSEPLVRWEGVVQEVKERTFSATLVELTTCSPKKDLMGKIRISSVPEEARKLVHPGAVFEWSIDSDGTSLIRFSRERWTAEEIERIEKRAAALSRKYGGDD